MKYAIREVYAITEIFLYMFTTLDYICDLFSVAFCCEYFLLDK